MKSEIMFIFLFVAVGSFATVIPNSGLTSEEQNQLMDKIKRVYSGKTDSHLLDERPVKYSVQESKVVEPNSVLKVSKDETTLDNFERLAQKKVDSKFMDYQCLWLKRLFPNTNCEQKFRFDSWEVIEAQDRVEELTKSWMPTTEFLMDKLPIKGETSISLWSDDYWKLQWGATSYRYGEDTYFSNYTEAISSYLQPEFWVKSLQRLSANQLSDQIATWSPAEKYDLITNDLNFGLTQEQKEEGRPFIDENGDVEEWMGLCHGWAAAAIMAPKAMNSFEVWGPSETKVKWFAHDVRALTTLAWSNGNFPTNFVGTRCNKKKPETYDNGRIKNTECFDNNPGTFHLALANLIGIAKASFIMDATFDYQVWNQPIKTYEFTYFNPLDPEKQSKNWEEVAVSYDDNFKVKDRFQTPLTRGKKKMNGSVNDDSMISKVVGVIATVVYLGEINPIHGNAVRNENLIRVSYTYDLELAQKNGDYQVVGGEWHTNAHPDFLWVPQKNSVALKSFDMAYLNFTGSEPPSELLSQQARKASEYGYPLCSVISKLLGSSAVGSQYLCHAY